MGCLSSKGSTIDPRSLDPTNILLLTDHDRKTIHKSWRLVMGTDNFRTNGPLYFIMLFEKYPYTMEYFDQFRGKKISEIRDTPILRAHGVAVFFSLSSGVMCMDDPDTFRAVVEKFASRHIPRNVSIVEMELVKEVFLEFIQQPFLGHVSPDAPAAWDKFFTVFNTIYNNTCEELKLAGINPSATKTEGAGSQSSRATKQGSDQWSGSSSSNSKPGA